MKKNNILLFLLVLPILLFSQKHTIKGTIEDASSGEKLLYTNVYDALSFKGTTSNYYGFYSLTLPAGKVKLIFSYLGYATDTIEFQLKSDTTINKTISQVSQIEEVVISETRSSNVASTQMGQMSIPIMQTKQMPVLFGETDIMKTIQLLPGVKGGTEGTSGIYVRGGGPDQNLILLDGVPVYNANHLFGFMSVFNSDAIQSFSLLKGGFPARYGGRLSSVIDIKMKEGNNKEYHGEGSIGLISSKLSVQGPIVKDKTSFIVSGRRTYFDILTWPIIYAASEGEVVGGYFFHDINAKLNHKFNDKSHIYYSFYNGLDKFYMRSANIIDNKDTKTTDKGGIGWGNNIHALRFNHILSNNLFVNITGTYSDYEFFTKVESKTQYADGKQDLFKVEYTSGIKDWGFKTDFDFIPSSNHYIKSGVAYIYHTFKPGINAIKVEDSVKVNQNNSSDIDTSFGNKNIFAHELSSYIEDDINITDKLKVNIGLHFSTFYVNNKNYLSLQPRISSRYLILDNLSVKASYVEMTQYINLLTNSNIGLPTDLWMPATKLIKPQNAQQYAVGIEYKINDQLDFSIESYYKNLNNLIEYKEGASFFSINDDWQQKLEQGKGWSKGIELLLQKTSGKTTGWIGYTLSKTDRQFAEISFGQKFPFKYDRRHDLAISVVHNFTPRFDMGLTWVFSTGSAVTLSEEKYTEFNPFTSNNGSYFENIEYLKSRNSYRMPNYHRLDVGFNFHKYKKNFRRTWSFGAYNAYNQLNPFYIDFKYENNSKNLVGYCLMPIMPYFSYNFKF